MTIRILILLFAFLLNFEAGQAKVFYVINNNDSGSGSLRSAIDSADNTAGYDSVYFNISGGSVSDRTIQLSTKLLVENGDILIDGTTQPIGNSFGYSQAKIYLKGNETIYGIQCDDGNVSIMGLVLDSFYFAIDSYSSYLNVGSPGKGNVIMNSQRGIDMYANYLTVQSNFIGLDTQLVSSPNYYGIYCNGWMGALIGGTDSSEGNKIAFNHTGVFCNTDNGVAIQSNDVYDNYTGIELGSFNFLIGGTLSKGGNYLHGNTYKGLYIPGGGGGKITGNRIDSTLGDGIYISYSDSVYILGNQITNSTGGGIAVFFSDHMQIGNGSDSASNIVAFNGSSGVVANSTTIRNNSIFCNTLKGIVSLGTPPNLLYYSPAGLSGISNPNAIIEIFQNHDCLDDCEGKTFLGSAVADNYGNFLVFNDTLSGVVTATQTVDGITSEFSACVEIDTLATGFSLLNEIDLIVFPNPTSGNSFINYTLSTPARVSIVLYDVLGNKLQQLVNSDQQQDEHNTTLDARKLANGIYVLQIRAGEQMAEQKVVVIN